MVAILYCTCNNSILLTPCIATPPLSPKKHDGTTSSPSRRHKQPAQTHDDTPNPTPVTPKQPTSVQPTQVTPKQPTSVTPKQPTSIQPTQVTPKQPTSVQPTQVTPKQPISVQPMQVTPKQPSSVTPSHDTPINLSVSYDYHQSFDARDLEGTFHCLLTHIPCTCESLVIGSISYVSGPVKSMEELAGLFKVSSQLISDPIQLTAQPPHTHITNKLTAWYIDVSSQDSPDGLPRVRCFTLWHEDTSPTLPPRKRAKRLGLGTALTCI